MMTYVRNKWVFLTEERAKVAEGPGNVMVKAGNKEEDEVYVTDEWVYIAEERDKVAKGQVKVMDEAGNRHMSAFCPP